MSATHQFPPPHLIPDDKVKDTTKENSGPQDQSSDSNNDKPAQQLALPSTDTSETTRQVEVSATGDIKHTIKFDDLGPLVINKDGTLSRIHNWGDMTDAERERTVKVLGKRNMLRKDAILKEN